VESYYKDSKIRCVLCYPNVDLKNTDKTLLRLLITQVHLLYLAAQSGSLSGGGSRCYV
jgi:hypothetical protein